VSTLVYHAGALGDFITSLPAITAWRQLRAGGGPLILLGRPAHAVLAAGVVDDAWDAGAARFASLFDGFPSTEACDLFAGVASALVFAPESAGIVKGLERAGVRDILRGDPFPRDRVHIVDHHLSLFPDLARAPGLRLPRIAVPAGTEPEGAGLQRAEPAAVGLQGAERADAMGFSRPIVLHPGSGSPSKNWPLERFAALARMLGGDAPIAWVLGPVEEESGAVAAIAEAVPAAQVWRRLPLAELARRLARARLFVGNDSGVAHLAAAADSPVVVLFGASDPAVWAPRGRCVTVVGDGASGMAALGVGEVTAACRQMPGVERGVDHRTIQQYDLYARQFSDRYESADMSRMHELLLRHLPARGASILELGCGSGREAAFLLSHGYEVTAVDASSGMIAEAGRIHHELAGRLVHAAVPFPPGSPLLLRSFDAVVSTAMFMHLPDDGLLDTALQIRRVLRPGGVLFVEVSTGRLGVRDGRDGNGRLFLERPPEEYRRIFENRGFLFVAQHESPDTLERPELRWVALVFRCP
jgi:heptosyltransferase-3